MPKFVPSPTFSDLVDQFSPPPAKMPFLLCQVAPNIAVEIERKNIVPPRRRMWVYLYDDGGRVGRAVVELSSKDGLVFLTADEKWALALRGEQGGTPLLLDSRLTCLDLTEGEKAAFHEACRAALRG